MMANLDSRCILDRRYNRIQRSSSAFRPFEGNNQRQLCPVCCVDQLNPPRRADVDRKCGARPLPARSRRRASFCFRPRADLRDVQRRIAKAAIQILDMSESSTAVERTKLPFEQPIWRAVARPDSGIYRPVLRFARPLIKWILPRATQICRLLFYRHSSLFRRVAIRRNYLPIHMRIQNIARPK